MFLTFFIQLLLPQRLLTRMVAKIANSRQPFIKNFVIKLYSRFYKIDMSEALEPNPINYATFNDFFVRALKPGVRTIATDAKAIASPVDGAVWQIGKASANQIISAKGKGFTLDQLFADVSDASRFHNANFAVLYLAPHNYHRVHMPIKGKLISARYIRGKLFSVNPKVADQIPDLFARNERVAVIFDTAFGKMAMILVGAMIVGSIDTVWQGIVTSGEEDIKNWDYSGDDKVFERAAEIASFNLGSTVILLFQNDSMEWSNKLATGTLIKMGQELGKAN